MSADFKVLFRAIQCLSSNAKCNNERSTGHGGLGEGDQSRQSLLRELGNQKIRTALTSGGAKPVLDDGGAGHSVFATAFLKVLTDNATALETERLYGTVRSQVVQTAERLKFEQVPTCAPIHMARHEGLGDFVFVPTGIRQVLR